MIGEKVEIVDGVRVRYLEKGSGKPMVLISGWMGTDAEAMLQSMNDVMHLDLRGELMNIDCQVLLIFGSRENLFADGYQKEIARLLPNCQLVTVSGGTHYLVLQKTREFARLVAGFLER